MIRLWLAIAGLGGISSVAVGALATHLADDAKAAELLRIGALYGMVHAAALIAVIGFAQGREPRRGAAVFAGWSFAGGIVLFSGSEAPPNWWTPLLSSGGSGKVSNGPGTASFYG